MPRGASEAVYKVISSAVANAENNLNLIRDDLFVAEIFASQGSHLKRMVPKAKGSSGRILKRTSHITVKLDEMQDGDAKVAKVADNLVGAKPSIKTASAKKKTTSKKAPAKTASKSAKKPVASKAASDKKSSAVSAKPTVDKNKKPTPVKKEDAKPVAKTSNTKNKETNNGSKG